MVGQVGRRLRLPGITCQMSKACTKKKEEEDEASGVHVVLVPWADGPTGARRGRGRGRGSISQQSVNNIPRGVLYKENITIAHTSFQTCQCTTWTASGARQEGDSCVRVYQSSIR